MSRKENAFIKAMAEHYNNATPREQRKLDARLTVMRAKTLASPAAMYHLFPTLKAKSLELTVQPQPEIHDAPQTPDAPATSEQARGEQATVEEVAGHRAAGVQRDLRGDVGQPDPVPAPQDAVAVSGAVEHDGVERSVDGG